MVTLLIIIYLAFISLGLPDSLLGSSWTVMHLDLNTSIEFAGLISMTVSGGTILSSLMSSRVIKRFGTGKVVAFSVAATAISLLGISVAGSVWFILLLALPLGLGAGAIDVALNNFVAIHYKAIHMNWLHSFWGIGATSGPLIMAYYLAGKGTWRDGYATIGIIQLGLVVVLIITLPLWKQAGKGDYSDGEANKEFVSNRQAFRIKGVKYAMLTFFFYCSLEMGTGLWAASYLHVERGVSVSDAALWTSMFFGGITLGRFISGIISEKITGEDLIRGGLLIISIGVLTLLLPLPVEAGMPALVLIGLGCAPIFPMMIHLTPERFGKKSSQAVIGLSMATAYIGILVMPPVIGLISGFLSLKVLPYTLVIFAVCMLIFSEKLRKIQL